MTLTSVIAVVFVFLTLLLHFVRRWYVRPKGFPPGPRGLPFVGVLPFMTKTPHRRFHEWSKSFGPVMSVRVGREDWVILNDFESVHQALVKQGRAFSGRPIFDVMQVISKGHGLATVDHGENWKVQRKFGIFTLRGFGVGKKRMEGRILEETEYLTDEIRKRQEKPFVMDNLLASAVSNVVSCIVFDKRFLYDDPWLIKMLYLLGKWISDPTKSSRFTALLNAPWLKYIPPFSSAYKELADDKGVMSDLIELEVVEHEKTHQDQSPRDFIDAFLTEMKKEEHDSFSKLQLLQYVRDLFEAGTETSSSTLRWAILCFLHYPETQQKLYNEIVDKIGEDGKPSMLHKVDMPYCSAFLEEVYRYRTLVPMTLIHKTSEDTMLMGYLIPKGTTIVPNLWAVHNDPDFWEEPEKFKPERHLTIDGSFVKSNHVIPFSVGPRYCIGEQLARMELFLFLVSLVRKFEFQPNPDDQELPDIEKGSVFGVFSPLVYSVVVRERCV